jgi:predicted ester cyclase
MSKEQQNKAIVARWFEGFWGSPWNPKIVDELAAPNILFQYSLHAPRRGREEVKEFIAGFREAFPDLKFWATADLIAEGDRVVGRWEGGGTHTGRAFSDFITGSLPANSGRKMHFMGTTVLRVKDGKIAEEIGLDDGVTALQQLGILKKAACRVRLGLGGRRNLLRPGAHGNTLSVNSKDHADDPAMVRRASYGGRDGDDS